MLTYILIGSQFSKNAKSHYCQVEMEQDLSKKTSQF